MPAERPVVERPHLEAVEADRAFRRLHEPGEQLDERRLAGPAAADDRDGFTWLDREVDPFEDQRRFRAAVTKADVLQLNAPCEGRHRT